MTDELPTFWAPRVLSILRIVAALIVLEHGSQKLFGFPPTDNPPAFPRITDWVVLRPCGGKNLPHVDCHATFLVRSASG